FEALVSSEDYAKLMNFPYLESCKQVDEFTLFIRGLNIKKISDWWSHKLQHRWIIPSIIKSCSQIYPEDWDQVPATTNGGEGQHHWMKQQTGSCLSLLEAILLYICENLILNHDSSSLQSLGGGLKDCQ
ncbi:hypothetical protein PILCRDRAFT_62944, partial [Piloderma croceum F 1598]